VLASDEQRTRTCLVEDATDHVGAADPTTESGLDLVSSNRLSSPLDLTPECSTKSTSHQAPPAPEADMQTTVADQRRVLEAPVHVHTSNSTKSVVPSTSVARSEFEVNSSASTPSLDLVPALAPSRPRTRLQDNFKKPKQLTYGTVRYDRHGFCATCEPQSLHGALGNENWKGAMNDEFAALKKSKTWHLVPAHMHII
jgi:hypothetical protein